MNTNMSDVIDRVIDGMTASEVAEGGVETIVRQLNEFVEDGWDLGGYTPTQVAEAIMEMARSEQEDA